jgi:carbamate kinase
MRVVVTIDGELLVSLDYNAGIAEQKAAITSIVKVLGNMLQRGDQVIICHGNAPQIGTMLLRSEAARHIIYPLPLDVCGADTQGATGYMFQQAIQSWLEQHGLYLDVVTLITQVAVSDKDWTINPAKKGVGPYFDKELAQVYHNTRGWDIEMVPGLGYQRAVPLMMPERIIETNVIRTLVENGALVICAGGGGIPIRIDARGIRVGIDAVVDKAYTSTLLAQEVHADAIIFVTPLEDMIGVIGPDITSQVRIIDPASLDHLVEEQIGPHDPLWPKLIAGKSFLRSGGKLVAILPPGELGKFPRVDYGIFLGGEEDLMIFRDTISDVNRRLQ